VEEGEEVATAVAVELGGMVEVAVGVDVGAAVLICVIVGRIAAVEVGRDVDWAAGRVVVGVADGSGGA
jgi:hypothetical protein